jgi:hypothetical protein
MNARHTVPGLLALLLAVAALPAGDGERHEAVLKEMIGAVDKLGTALTAVQDADSAKAARPELKKGAQTFVAARDKSRKLPPPDKEAKDRLAKTYRPKLEAAMKKLFTEVRRVETVPGGDEALVEIQPILRDNGKKD